MAVRHIRPHTSLDTGEPVEDAVTRPAAFYTLAVLAAALLVAACFRIVALGAQSAWLDEGYSLAVASHPVDFIISFTRHSDLHPPLYYLTLHAWMGTAGNGVSVARLLSATFGVLSVAAIYFLAATLFDRPTGLVSALLCSISPVAVWYSDEVRMYAMVCLIVAVALFALIRAMRGRTRFWLLYLVAGALAFYTDYSAGYALVVGAGYALWAPTGRLRAQALLAHAALLLLVLPALVTGLAQSRDLAPVSWIPAPNPTLVGASLMDLVSLHSPLPLATALLSVVLAALGIWAMAAGWADPENRKASIFVLCTAAAPIILPLILSVIHPVFLTRTILTALVGILILFARGIVFALRRDLLLRAAGALAFCAVAALNVASVRAQTTSAFNADWRGAASYLGVVAQPNDLLLFDPSFGELPFDRYWTSAGRRNVERGYPADETLLHPHPRSLSAAGMRQVLRRGATVWLVAGAGNTFPQDPAARWLAGHLHVAGSRPFYGLTVWRFTALSMASAATAPWLDAASVLLPRVQPRDLVVLNGSAGEARAFRQMWDNRPHPAARLVTLAASNPDLSALAHAGTRAVWLVTAVRGTGDPAAVDNNWLYHHGPMMWSMDLRNGVHAYGFLYTWGKG